jgi:hypothetical protein
MMQVPTAPEEIVMRCSVLPRWWRLLACPAFLVTATIIVSTSSSSRDNEGLCLELIHIARAENATVGMWQNPVWRNDGVSVSCERRTIQFKLFLNLSSQEITPEYNQRAADRWNASHCSLQAWRDAIADGWQIELFIAMLKRESETFDAMCN